MRNMKKKKYESPTIEEIKLEVDVVIAASAATAEGDAGDSEFGGAARAPKRGLWR